MIVSVISALPKTKSNFEIVKAYAGLKRVSYESLDALELEFAKKFIDALKRVVDMILFAGKLMHPNWNEQPCNLE